MLYVPNYPTIAQMPSFLWQTGSYLPQTLSRVKPPKLCQGASQAISNFVVFFSDYIVELLKPLEPMPGQSYITVHLSLSELCVQARQVEEWYKQGINLKVTMTCIDISRLQFWFQIRSQRMWMRCGRGKYRAPQGLSKEVRACCGSQWSFGVKRYNPKSQSLSPHILLWRRWRASLHITAFGNALEVSREKSTFLSVSMGVFIVPAPNEARDNHCTWIMKA